MEAIVRIAETRIERAVQRGELDDLPGAGKPLDLDRLRRVPREQRAAQMLLRSAGVLPEELSVGRQIHELDAEIAAAGPRPSPALRRRRMLLELKREIAAERRLRR